MIEMRRLHWTSSEIASSWFDFRIADLPSLFGCVFQIHEKVAERVDPHGGGRPCNDRALAFLDDRGSADLHAGPQLVAVVDRRIDEAADLDEIGRPSTLARLVRLAAQERQLLQW